MKITGNEITYVQKLPEKKSGGNEAGKPDPQEIAAEGQPAVNRDRIEFSAAVNISENAGEAAENEAVEEETEETSGEESAESEKAGGKVAVNVSKRARQIASASTPDEVQIVLELLSGDLNDCKAGLEKGWCDEEEIAKVEALIEMANKRMGEVAGNEEDENKGIDAFQLNMLF